MASAPSVFSGSSASSATRLPGHFFTSSGAPWFARLVQQAAEVAPVSWRNSGRCGRRKPQRVVATGLNRISHLLKLGLEISERTVSRLLPKCKKPPSQTWRAFLNNRIQDLVSIDFFTVPTATFRILFVLVVLAHQRRRVVHINVTEHPTAGWTGQQMVEAFPEDTSPRYLLRDRDKIYGCEFHQRI